MNRQEVWKHVSDALRSDFGRLLDVRDVRRVRRVAGDAWLVTVVLAATSGDVHVADLTVAADGAISPLLSADSIVDAVRRSQKASLPPAQDALDDFGGDLNDETPAGLEMLVEIEDTMPIPARVEAALGRGDIQALREARDLLPRLLGDHERRGATLLTMAEVELKLGERGLARGYIEAAAREFADRFDLNALERAAALALDVGGRDAFEGSAIHTLLERSRARLKPIARLTDAPSLAGLGPELAGRLVASTTRRTLAPGEALVNEGDPSSNVFVVRSGLLGVWLEKPSGGSWLVRCCFPGWLLGESSVLAGQDARCTASLRAERVSDVWVLPAAAVRVAMDEDLAFGLRIAQTKQMHRIDSFFSMHETMGQLDVQVRDDMLSCFQRLEKFDAETILLPANEIPEVACLVAQGSIGLFDDGSKDGALAVVPTDSFYGVRDAIHQIAPSVTAIASPGTVVAFFDAGRLRKLCERSPEHVVAVLERLG